MLSAIPKKHLKNITAKLKKFSNYKLKEDGLRPISKDLILRIWPILGLYGDFLKKCDLESGSIQVFPMKAGGITIEFNKGDVSLELMLTNEGESEFFIVHADERESDGEFSFEDKEEVTLLFKQLHNPFKFFSILPYVNKTA